MTSEQSLRSSNITESVSRRAVTKEKACSTVSKVVADSFKETLQETLCQALQDGYNGVDISHIEIEGFSTHSKLDVWQADKWHKEPPEQSREHCQRYDFRYYDRKRLFENIKYCEWPSLLNEWTAFLLARDWRRLLVKQNISCFTDCQFSNLTANQIPLKFDEGALYNIHRSYWCYTRLYANRKETVELNRITS